MAFAVTWCSPRSDSAVSSCQFQASVIADSYYAVLVEVTDSLFEYLLAHLETTAYVFWVAFVAEVAAAVMVVYVVEQSAGKAFYLSAACGRRRLVRRIGCR